MKVSVNWLKEFVDISLSNEELVKKIGSQLGEVEETIELSKKYEGITIARVIKCEKHPNADKLKVCQIDAGKGKVQVVCGAPNVHEGQLVAWIPPGKIIPATFDKDPFVLEARKIRGEISNGMLASGHELDLNNDHDGILTLEEGKPGDDFAIIYGLDDFIIDIENKMFTHRPDCFGLLGVAREVAGIQQKIFQSPGWYLEDKNQDRPKEGLKLTVKNELPELAPRFMAQVIENFEVKPSPLEIQVKLKKIGIKPINNIVDITNYVMYLTGQPLHAYDYDKVAAISAKDAAIVIRKPKKGEKIKLLGGKLIEPHSDAVMIATDQELIGIGGVMGGADTEVDAKTKNIILECANFNLYSIRRTSMIHGLFTDAVTRFSKGQSPLQNGQVFSFASEMINRQAGGTPTGKTYDLHEKLSQPKPVQIDNEFINSRLGLDLKAEEIVDILKNVEFKAEITRGSVMIIQAPFWRTDIEIKEDVVEEIGRLYGYDNLPLVLPKISASPSIVAEELKTKKKLRMQLASLGANEVLTYSFVHENLLKAVGQDPDLAFKIKNALSPDLQYYRLSLTPSLIEKVHSNVKAGFDNFALFEIGKVHGKSEISEDGIPKELGRVAGVVCGDYFQAKYFLEQLYPGNLGITYEQRPDKTLLASHKMASAMLAPFSNQRSAVAFVDGKPIGAVGEFKPSVYKKFKLPQKCAGFELFLTPIVKSRQLASSSYRPMSKYPALEQDISLKTEFSLSYGEISAALQETLENNAPKDIQIKVKCIDIFAKDKKTKHTTFRITAESSKRTLAAEMINKLLDKTAQELEEKINAKRI